MVMPSQERWTAMWRSFGAEEPQRLYDELMARYAEPHRHYHTAQHLDECLALYDEIGAPPARFDEYERQVRAEYTWGPEFLFRRKRRAILEAFMARPAIYATAPLGERLEARARANLARSLARLRER